MKAMMTKPVHQVRKINNLKDLIDQSGALYSESYAYMRKNKKDVYEGITYKQLKDDIYSFGTVLLDMNMGKSKIAVISETRYEWAVTFLAVTCGGGVIVPLDKELPKVEIENLIKRSGATAIVFSKKYKEMVVEFLESCPNLKLGIDMDANINEKDIYSFAMLLSDGAKAIVNGNHEYAKTEIDNEQLAGLFFTSGTTDLAKGVMLSHKNLATNVMGGCSMVQFLPSDRVLSILPLHHTYECTCDFLMQIYSGSTIYICEGLKHIQKNLQESKPTVLLVVPLIVENIYKKIWSQIEKKGIKGKVKFGIFLSNLLLKFNVDIRKKLFKDVLAAFGGELRIAIVGGAAPNAEVLKGLRAFGIGAIQGYGLTESSPLAAVNIVSAPKDKSIGRPLPDVLMEIVEPDDKGTGEIRIKSDSIMMGYYENKEATDAVIRDGWFYTGDIGYREKDGYFYITGRKKNVIVTKNGKNIFPEEVEAYMLKSPFISEIVVYGKEVEDDLETKVCAIVVPNYEEIKTQLNKGKPEEVKELIDSEIKKYNKEMPLYKMVREFEIRETEFVKTTTKKIKRAEAVK